MKPFTVILMLPEQWLEDQPSASDKVTRVWVTAEDTFDAIQNAFAKLPEQFPAEPNIPVDDFRTVAVYPGHLFDEYVA